MSVNIKVTGGLNIEWGQIDPKATGGLNSRINTFLTTSTKKLFIAIFCKCRISGRSAALDYIKLDRCNKDE